MGAQSHRVLLTVNTDIDFDGHPVDHWLLATSELVAVVDGNPRSVQLADRSAPDDLSRQYLSKVGWDEIFEFRTQAGVGSGLLQAKTADGWLDILRFSNELAGRFHKVARRLERLREGNRDDHALDLRDLDSPRCTACGLRLEHAYDDCPRCLQKGQILRRLGEMLRPHARGAFVLCGLTIVGVAAELIPPKLQQYMVDEILGHQSGGAGQIDFSKALLVVVLALMATRVVLAGVSVIKGQVATIIGSGLTSALREQMVHKLQKMAVVYYDRHQVGSTLSRVAHDSEVLHGLMHQLTGGFLLQMVQLVGVGAMLLWINPKLAMFTLIPVPLVFVGTWFFWQKVYPKHFRLRDAASKQMSVLSGMLSGIRVVKAFSQEDREYQRFQHSSDRLRQWRLQVDFTNDRYAAAMSLVFSMGGLIVWYVGGRDVIGDQMTLGQLIAFLAYLAMFYAPLSALSNFTTWLTSFLSGSKRVLELLDAPMTLPEPQDPTAWDQPRGEVEFNEVTFGYDRNQPVLSDISFRIAPGEMIGIVGRSGSGKTTMVNLLSRFYDVQEGSIRIDGIDVRQLSSQQLREGIGIVFQDSFLFRGTIWKNLSYGRPQSSIEEGLEAAKAAGAHDFICRSQLGYETLLGEYGAGLSGGEKQRLSIARTLLYNPRILILDEATSNIDAESERSIQKALDRLVRGRTTLAIAHRLSTLRNADRIFVFDRGRIVEHGSHAELLSRDGIYARMVRIQTQVTKAPHVDQLVAVMEDREQGESELLGCDRPDPAGSDNTNAVVGDSLDSRSRHLTGSSSSVTDRTDPENRDETCIQWLDSKLVQFQHKANRQLTVQASRGFNALVKGSVFAVRAFPASHPDEFISIRGWDERGDELELGMIRRLSDFSASDQDLILESLRRRYLLREIHRIHKVDLRQGFLEFEVETQQGREEFLLRWSASQAIEYGSDGKLLIDTEENRYLVPSVSSLNPADQEKFERYVYW
jgi:ATP-binding cassette, subfamily B, bacterial